MSSATIPDDETLKKSGAAQNIKPELQNPAANSVGPFCQLATGITAPISDLITSVYSSLQSLEGAINTLIYAPARGIQLLQARILSGELLNNLTANLQASLSRIIKNTAKAIAKATLSNLVGRLATSAKNIFGNVIGRVKTSLTTVFGKVTKVLNGVNQKLTNMERSMAASVLELTRAGVTGSEISKTALQNQPTFFSQLGQDLAREGRIAALSIGREAVNITKTILAPPTLLFNSLAPYQQAATTILEGQLQEKGKDSEVVVRSQPTRTN